MFSSTKPIAHVRESDGEFQLLKDHLAETAEASQRSAEKCGLAKAGALIGLLHDLGKHSQEFQTYLKSAVGFLNPDEDEDFVDTKGLKGRVDHSTAGAQLLWRQLSSQGQLERIAAQILALCIVSHHSGLIDCLSSFPSRAVEDAFSQRMGKAENKTHLIEATLNMDSHTAEQYHKLLSDGDLVVQLKLAIRNIISHSPDKTDKSVTAQFQIGLLVRFLFSCLIDADRMSTADFEKPHAARQRQQGRYAPWEMLAQRLEKRLASMEPRNPKIDAIRKEISERCLDASSREKGLFTLSVPTGGGKTLASLRFALQHAKRRKMDRVIYIVPFTSIIDQNADVARQILEPEDCPQDRGRIVLEHHSNITPEKQSWREKILSENWDAPIVFTTSAQLLEALFGSGTRGVRRMHQLANAVIVFDEIQTLPVRCVHLFNNAINFLVEACGSTVVLCTATQPLLGDVDPKKGALCLSQGCEIMPDVQRLFDDLKRVHVHDCRKDGGWTEPECADLAVRTMGESGSCLVVVNTKKAAKSLYLTLQARETGPIYHLSTSMCPTHRREILAKVRNHLSLKEPVLCISTQLIEAGVDVDFGSVIRYLAGLDSIAQAAGRCNRNGQQVVGHVYVINPSDENLDHLDAIRIGADKARRVLDDFRERPHDYDGDSISPKAMAWYYRNYFFDRKNEMDYPVKIEHIGREDTLLNLFSTNTLAVNEYGRRNGRAPDIYLRQSFMTAAKAFQAIDAPAQGVIVQHNTQGRNIVAELCAAHDVEKQQPLLRLAQQHTVNVFPHEFHKLIQLGALTEIHQGTGIYYLNERHYSQEFGLSIEPVSPGELLYA